MNVRPTTVYIAEVLPESGWQKRSHWWKYGAVLSHLMRKI